MTVMIFCGMVLKDPRGKQCGRSKVQDFLQMRVTARAWNDATKCGPYRLAPLYDCARAVSSQEMMLEGPSWEAMQPFSNVPEIAQMRATAQAFHDATKYGPYCELFFFSMRRETDPTEPIPARHVSTESLFFLRPAGCTAFPLEMTT